MDGDKKRARVELLTTLGTVHLEQSLVDHIKAGGDPDEIVFNAGRLVALVDEYDIYLENYRRQHINAGAHVAGDKIGAITGCLVMRYNIFSSKSRMVNTPFSSWVNESFAVRICQLFVRKAKAGFNPIAHRHLLHCFENCYEDDTPMLMWAIATLQQHLDWGSVKEPAFLD